MAKIIQLQIPYNILFKDKKGAASALEEDIKLTAPIAASEKREQFSEFISHRTWPQSTKYHCWSCTLPITSKPVACPVNVNRNENGEFVFRLKGIMCSFACVMRFIDSNVSQIQKPTIINIVHLLHIAMRNSELKNIEMAPHFSELKRFGGHLTDDEMSLKIATLNIHATPIVLEQTPRHLQGGSWNLYNLTTESPHAASATEECDVDLDDLI